jgi:hypothetical protein
MAIFSSRESQILTEKGQRISFYSLLSSSSIQEARRITANFFLNHSQKMNFPKVPYDSQWAFYDLFYNRIALPFTQLNHLKNTLNDSRNITIINCPPIFQRMLKGLGELYDCNINFESSADNDLKVLFINLYNLIQNIVLSIISLVSFLYLIFTSPNSNKLGIWSGDFLDKTGTSDPRLLPYIELLIKHKTSYIEFIRHANQPLSTNIKNLVKRKRPVIFYLAIESFIPFKPPMGNSNLKFKSNEDILKFAFEIYKLEAHRLKKSISLWSHIFKLLKIKKFMPWFLSSRTASLLWAAKINKSPTIGMMHGMSQIENMGHEYMPEYSGEPISTDFYGVWGNKWKKDFSNFSKIYPKDGIEISGPLRPPLKGTNTFKTYKQPPFQILLISEPNVPPSQVMPYVEAIIDNPQYEVTLKVRPSGADPYHDSLKKNFPKLYSKLNISSQNIALAFPMADLVIGSYSTAVIEAGLFQCPFLFLNTQKWGDYFKLTEEKKYGSLFIHDPSQFIKAIDESLKLQDFSIYDSLINDFFSPSNGANWLFLKSHIESYS